MNKISEIDLGTIEPGCKFEYTVYTYISSGGETKLTASLDYKFSKNVSPTSTPIDSFFKKNIDENIIPVNAFDTTCVVNQLSNTALDNIVGECGILSCSPWFFTEFGDPLDTFYDFSLAVVLKCNGPWDVVIKDPILLPISDNIVILSSFASNIAYPQVVNPLKTHVISFRIRLRHHVADELVPFSVGSILFSWQRLLLLILETLVIICLCLQV